MTSERHALGIVASWFLAVLLAAPACGQDDDDEQPAGLRATYRVGQAVVERVDHDIAFPWDKSAPDKRLPEGPFDATWTGTLLLRSEAKYRFHAFAQGQVSLKVNGQSVLQGQADRPQWISGPETTLSFGDQPFELTFARTGDAAQLSLYWSSSEFPLEPVPYHVFFQTKPSPDLTLIERGRIQFESHRCGNCHADRLAAESRLEAPSLEHVGAGTSVEWIIERLMQGTDAAAPRQTGRMPHFGFSKADAESIVASLLSKSTEVELTAAAKLKESERAKDLQAGLTLIRSVGCLACHTWNSLGENTPFGGGSLDSVAEHRTANWLSTWLAHPDRLNKTHRMPVFNLSDKERATIVLALTSSAKAIPNIATKPPVADAAILARGARLMEESRCAACHVIPGRKDELKLVHSLRDSKTNWDQGCSRPVDRSRNKPSFPGVVEKALKAYVASWKQVSSEPNAGLLDGAALLQRKNCLGCHDRNESAGLSRHAATIAKTDETLAGLHMTLIPPRLNAVGDRMHDAGLAEAIRGEQKTPRLNWLRVRMPKFNHNPAEQKALLSHLVGHDRNPDGGPQKPTLQARPAGTPPDPQQILAGRELLGGKGFSCVACHAVKDYTPKVTALGTRGSNLHLIGQRMRTEYFFRWTRAPLRIMPGVEMPNYQKPHEFILPGQLDQQLIAIWEALNDPTLSAPTNPAVVEQLMSLGEHDPPRVVRDVFTVPGATDETVARAYAVGLPGGHSVLLDLETGGVRGWTLGDFARQRCEGKRWYWDLAGTILASGFEKTPDIALVDEANGIVASGDTGWNIAIRLKSEERRADSVALHYELSYAKEGTIWRIPDVRDEFSAIRQNGIHGWKRTITISPAENVWPWLRNVTPTFVQPQSQVSAGAGQNRLPKGLPTTAVRFGQQDQKYVATVTYQTSLRWQNSTQQPVVPLISHPDPITTVPGFRGQRLRLPRSIMPTAMTWDDRGRLLFTSLKGHLYQVNESTDETTLSVIEEGLAAPFGVITDGQRVIVSHKPELLRLTLSDSGQVASRDVLATGWGVTDDYHDWTCGIARDSQRNLYIGLGSDYTFKNRPQNRSRWRGDILKVDGKGNVESIARGLRYPTGLAIDDQDRLFVSDQQGVQNTFNELNYIQVGHRYGVPSRHEAEPNAPADPPAVQIPHPWTRSVNGIAFLPKANVTGTALAPLAGQFIGCEFNNNILIRLSIQTVDGTVQGATYPFSRPTDAGDNSNFSGPLCISLSPLGEIFVGSLQDGGWAGGLNMGDIVRLKPSGEFPNGIREIRATSRGFDLEFFHQVDPALAAQPSQYKIAGYTRVWKGDYATPDSGHHTCDVKSATIGPDGRTVSLLVEGRKTGHVYDMSVGDIGAQAVRSLWPAIGHYTLHRIPD